MCTIAFSYQMHSQFPLIIISNRDEFYSRPTQKAKFWHENEHVFGGIDLLKSGTWLGITKEKKFSFLTNYRNASRHLENPRSRGLLTKAYLMGSLSPKKYVTDLHGNLNQYDPFNLFVGDMHELYYLNNINCNIEKVSPGIHAISNAFLDESWPKVDEIKCRFKSCVEKKSLDVASLFQILSIETKYPKHMLPQTGLPDEMEKMLSSIFISDQSYGTRYQVVLLVDQYGHVNFYENERDQLGQWSMTHTQF